MDRRLDRNWIIDTVLAEHIKRWRENRIRDLEATIYQGDTMETVAAPTPTPPPTNPRLQRQESLKLNIPRGVAIIGCGGVGSWVAFLLALAGVTNLWLFDHDVVSDHNLNRLPLMPDTVGKSKSEALAAMLKAFRPDCSPTACGRFTAETADALKLPEECTWLCSSTDSLVSRKLTHTYASDHGLYYIEASAEGEYGSIADAPAEWATEAETQPGYASVPVWVGPCTAAATMACAYILHGMPPEMGLSARLGFEAYRRIYSARGVQFYKTDDNAQEEANAPVEGADDADDEEVA